VEIFIHLYAPDALPPPPPPPRKELRYPLNRRLGELRSRSERFGEEENFFPVLEFEPRIVQPLA
jgi:hypothetical protein